LLNTAIAFCLEGARALGVYETVPGNVLYFDLEAAGWQNKGRLKKILSYYEEDQGDIITGVSPHTIYFYSMDKNPVNVLDAEGMKVMEEEIVKVNASLVVIDTIARLMPVKLSGSNSYYAEYKFYSELQKLAQKMRCGIVLLHHESKGKKDGVDPLDRASGTSAFPGVADSFILMTRKRSVRGIETREGNLYVTGRAIEQRNIALRWCDGRGFIVENDPLLASRGLISSGVIAHV